MINSVAKAKKEFSTVLLNFVQRKPYVSSHFNPHRFDVLIDATTGVAKLEFEIGPAATITIARWDGKVLTYMPNWQPKAANPGAWQTQLQMERDAYDILYNNDKGVTDSPGILPIIIKEVVTSAKELTKWEYAIEEALVPGRDASQYGVGWTWDYVAGPGPWFGPPLGGTRRYHGEYPYVLDVKNMRILSPNLARAFHRAKNLHKKRFFFQTLDTLKKFFGADSVPEGIKKEFDAMKRLLAAIEDIGFWLRPFFLEAIIDNISSGGLKSKVPELLVTSKSGNVRRSCCEILLRNNGVVLVPQQLQNDVAKRLLEHQLDRTTKKP